MWTLNNWSIFFLIKSSSLDSWTNNAFFKKNYLSIHPSIHPSSATLGLHCCTQTFSGSGEQGLLFLWCLGLSCCGAGALGTQASAAALHGLRCSAREGHSTPLQYSHLENPMDGGTWKAAVHGVAKSQTQLSGFTFTFHFHALEKEMATHSSVLAWRIPGTAEPGGLPSMGSHRVGHDWSHLAAAAAALQEVGSSQTKD